MPPRKLLSRSTAAIMIAFAGAHAAVAADTFPTKPIHLVVPAAPGGGIDIVSRLIADKMGEYLKEPVVVDSRAGAETLLGTRYVKDQPADGYTIMAQANGFLTMSALKLDPGYDPMKDFTGIGTMQTSPMIIETGGSNPEKSLGDVVTNAKAHPGQLTFASGGVGAPPHVILSTFLLKAGITGTHVLYKGNGAALPDIAGGRVNLLCDTYISSLEYYKSGKIRPLGVSSDTRMTALPDVPTFKEQGINFSYTLWLGLLAPNGTPKEVVQRLSDALHYATTRPDIMERFHREGSEPGTDTPEQFKAFLAKDMAASMPEILALGIPKQ